MVVSKEKEEKISEATVKKIEEVVVEKKEDP